MNKLYYLSSCSTCKRIIKQWSFAKSIDLIDIKKTPINHKDLQELYKITNSYESLFNKRAQMLKKLNLNTLQRQPTKTTTRSMVILALSLSMV